LTSFPTPSSPREWQAVIGIDNETFTELVGLAHSFYQADRGCSYVEMLSGNAKGHLAKFKELDDLLFFCLLMLKSGITFDLLGFISGIDQSNAHKKFKLGLSILNETLKLNNYTPYRDFDEVAHFHQLFSPGQTIILDGTEQRIQRPSDQGMQREFYSGKKKGHTVKSLIMSTPDRYVHYISYCWVGRTHDFAILKEEFPASDGWFDPFEIRLDLGYHGFAKEYPGVKMFLPQKKPRGGELTEEQKDNNRRLAKERITVEHTIGGIKRYDFLSNTCRIHDWKIYDSVLETCAGLWNLFITR